MDKKFSVIDSLLAKGIINLRLEYLIINKFRYFESQTKVSFEHPFTVLVGKNGSGKSTFLKLIKSLAKDRNPDHYFFETEWDNFDNDPDIEFQYKIDGSEFREFKTKYFGWVFSPKNMEFDNNKSIKAYLENPENKTFNKILNFEFKHYIGSFEKNTFFDNQTKRVDLKYKAEYARKVTKKIQQSIDTKNSKEEQAKLTQISKKNIDKINGILGKNYNEIKIIEHRFFNGTWGTSIIFKSDTVYSEANSGSGEFIIANVINELSAIPNNSIVLLDEPELSLHPGSQKRFLEYLLDLIIEKKLQIIVSTHSPIFIEKIPSSCIKNFILSNNNIVRIEEEGNYLNAFINIEYSYDMPNIIVEDVLAKNILEKVIENENLTGQFNVRFYPGGASSIKTSLITTFSKIDDSMKFVLFDGDMFIKEAIDLSTIPELSKTKDFLKHEIKSMTNINVSKFSFHADGSKRESNEEQKKELYKKYIEFYRNNVYFFPEKIPEDIIFSLDFLKQIKQIFPNTNNLCMKPIEEEGNSKEKFNIVSNQLSIRIDTLYDLFITNFILCKTSNYDQIKEILQSILKKSKGVI